MTVTIAVAVFPVIFLAELPDKSMFAALLLATRGRPISVWAGAALAFAVHTALAVTIGGVLFALLPPRVVEAIVALLFLAKYGKISLWQDDLPYGQIFLEIKIPWDIGTNEEVRPAIMPAPQSKAVI